MRVSNPDPMVSIVTVPSASGVQVYQMDLPPGLFAWLGSPASLPEPVLVAEMDPLEPISGAALEKSSFEGRIGSPGDQFS